MTPQRLADLNEIGGSEANVATGNHAVEFLLWGQDRNGFDADNGYQTAYDLAVDGIRLHELRLHPDGETLVVALGGIKTHPDYDRVKLNLDTMAPALLLMNRKTGAIQARFTPSHHPLSCRHLDVGPDGTVMASYQYQGPKWDTPTLIVHLNTTTGEFSELALNADQRVGLRHYTASIAIHPEQPVAAITAP